MRSRFHYLGGGARCYLPELQRHGENRPVSAVGFRHSSCNNFGVRVRITRVRAGEIDGVDLADFEVGITYNLPPTLAAYLVVTMSAEFVDTVDVRPETQLFRGVPPPPAIAADDGQDDDES